jgi:5-methylcytosine-specific restriction endonuclease McrA
VKRTKLQRLERIRRTCPLRRTWRERKALVAFRLAVLEAAGYRCQRCGVPDRRRRIEAHHILPRSRGGKHTKENGAALCGGPRGCHALVHRHEVDDWRAWIETRRDES